MKLFIKISKDGKAVQVLKTIFSNTISEEEFNKKSERLTSREFITRFSKNIDEGIINKIERLREIYEMKLSALGNFNIFNKENQIVGIGYFSGDEIIDEEYAGQTVREEALMYAKRFYGSEFMKNNENKLDDERVTYFSNKKEISYEEYAELMKEIKELTKIISIKKELNNFFRR